MFWSLVLEPLRRYSSTIMDTFHLSMATLDLKTVKDEKEVFPVMLKFDGKDDVIICNLGKATSPQACLDLNIEKGSKISFYTKGNATVHLTGYIIPEEYDSGNEDTSSTGDYLSSHDSLVSADEEASEEKGKGDAKSQSQLKKKRKNEETLDVVSKKKIKSKSGEEEGGKNGLDMRMKTLNHSKILDTDSDDDDDDDDDEEDSLDAMLGSEESDDSESETFDEADGKDDDDSDDDDEDDEDDNDDEDESEDSDDSEVLPPLRKALKSIEETPKKKADEKTPKHGKTSQTPKQGKTPQNQTPKAAAKTPQNQTPASNKKQSKQNVSMQNGATPKSEKKAKNSDNKDTPKPKEAGKDAASPKKQTLAGGLQIEELKTGKGPVAKAGKMVSVFYIGRLKHNNRVFDQTQSHPGLKFRLGKGEVIKGWDLGIAGMTVGSKRRLTIPPSLAYGSKGSGSQIPPNATLVFDVELKTVT